MVRGLVNNVWVLIIVFVALVLMVSNLNAKQPEPQINEGIELGASLSQIRDKVDTRLAELWPTVVQKQEAYYAKHGRYFGFNWTPADPVYDGTDTDMGEIQRPSKFHVAEDVQFPINTQLPAQFQIINHNGPDGQGFTAMVKVYLPNGNIYMRTQGYGAHSETRPWFLFDPNEPRP